MTYHPDSVLVEKVAIWLWEQDGDRLVMVQKWADVDGVASRRYELKARALLRVACPLVAGVIADRLDERYAERSGDDSHSTMSDWDFARRDGLVDAAALVRSEFVDGG